MAQDPIRPNSAAASARKALQEAGITLKRAGTDLQQRLERRQQQRAQNQQVNLETILSLALKNCGETACDHPLDADWLDVFLALAEKTSNPEMQQLWALIFAKEASMRGSFSTRSLRLLSELTRKDAEMFQRAVALSCQTQGDSALKIIFGCHYTAGWRFLSNQEQSQLSLNLFGLPYSSLLWLMEHGLIHTGELETSSLSMSQDYQLKFGPVSLQLRPKVERLKLRYYRLTPVGEELARLVAGKTNADYQQALAAILAKAVQFNQNSSC